MRKFLLVLTLLCIEKALHAQTPYVYTIKADSVKITNSCDTAELIIENHTQNVRGFLFNKGRGRTEFRRPSVLNDSSLIFGGDTLVVKGSTTASNGLSMTGKDVQLGQLVGASGNPAALKDNREIPLNGKNIYFNGGTGNIVIGSNTDDGFRLKTPSLQVGKYLNSSSYFTSYHVQDSITSSNVASSKSYEIVAYRDINYTEDGLSVPLSNQYHNNVLQAFNILRIGSSLTFDQSSPYTGVDGAFFALLLRKRAGFSGTTTFNGPSSAIGASAAIQARVDVADIYSASNNLLANGWYCGIKPVICTHVGNTVENFVWLNAGTGQFIGNGCVKNAYGLYISGLNSLVTNKWAIYQAGINDTNYLAGKMKLPNLDVKTDTTSYKPVVVDASGNIFKMAGWNVPQITRTAVNDVGYSALATDYLVAYTNLTASRTVTLPAASGMANRILIIKDESGAAGTNNITVNVTAGGTIDGASSKSITTNYGVLEVYSNGSQWFTK